MSEGKKLQNSFFTNYQVGCSWQFSRSPYQELPSWSKDRMRQTTNILDQQSSVISLNLLTVLRMAKMPVIAVLSSP